MTIGKSEHRIDALAKVTGAALYPADLAQHDCLHAKVVFSDQPHARMLSADTSAAEAVDGVVAVLTAKHVPRNEYGLVVRDQPVLVGCDGHTNGVVDTAISRWEGDHVAIVIGQSPSIAARAAELLRFDWEQLPVVPDVEAAAGAVGGKPSHRFEICKGDIDAGWAAADVVIEGHYRLPHQEHAYLQPEAAVSYVDEKGRITVETAGQWVHEDQRQIAHALALPTESVRVVYPAIGGAFGGREDVSLQIVMALAALRLNERGETRPIRTVWSREESIIGHHKRHRGTVHARWGATRAGRITAVETDIVLDTGAYAYTTSAVLRNVALYAVGPYDVPNARIESSAFFTNSVPGGAFRVSADRKPVSLLRTR